MPWYLLGTVAERAVTAPTGANWSQQEEYGQPGQQEEYGQPRHKTWIPPKRPLLRTPPSPKGARLSRLASSPALGLSPLCCRVLLSAGEPGSSEGGCSDSCGRDAGDGSHGSAGRSTQAAPGAVLIPAAQGLPSVPIHCRCAGEQGAGEPGSPCTAAHTARGRATSLPAGRQRLPAPLPAALHCTALPRAAESPGALCNNAKQI